LYIEYATAADLGAGIELRRLQSIFSFDSIHASKRRGAIVSRMRIDKKRAG